MCKATWNGPTEFHVEQREKRRCVEFIPPSARRILDLGTGDGRLLALVRRVHPDTEAVAIDFSATMLAAARKRFDGDSRVRVVEHNLDASLPDLGKFDAIISCFAIHHLVHERKRALYAEIFSRLSPGGVFAIWNMCLRLPRAFMKNFC